MDLQLIDMPAQHLDAIVVVIDPSLASKWLGKNFDNRPISARVVNQYAEDMIHGRWKLNGETIKIAASGRIIDGQHRLQACVKAKRSFVSLVARNLPDDIFDTVDRGYSRTLQQVFNLSGEKNSSLLTAGLRILDSLTRERALNSATTSFGALNELLDVHPETREWAAFVSSRKILRTLQPPGCTVALGVLFGKKNTELAIRFYEALDAGQDIIVAGVAMLETKNGEQPVMRLRQKLLQDRLNTKRLISREEVLALNIKTWNAVRTGRGIKVLRWRTNGAAESMPAIV